MRPEKRDSRPCDLQKISRHGIADPTSEDLRLPRFIDDLTLLTPSV